MDPENCRNQRRGTVMPPTETHNASVQWHEREVGRRAQHQEQREQAGRTRRNQRDDCVAQEAIEHETTKPTPSTCGCRQRPRKEKANMGTVISARHAKTECDELRLKHAHIRLKPDMANTAS